jgi:hypothetical protein
MDTGAREQREELDQAEPGNRLEPQAEAADDKASETGPIAIDTTAEPLGSAKPRRPRARAGAAARSTRKTTAPKKPAARPTTRSRKTARSDSGGKNES